MKLTLGKSYYEDGALGKDINKVEQLKEFAVQMVNGFIKTGKVIETSTTLIITPEEETLQIIRREMLDKFDSKVSHEQLKDMVVKVVSGNLTVINVREHVLIDNNSEVDDPRYSDGRIKLYYTVDDNQSFELSPRDRDLDLLRMSRF